MPNQERSKKNEDDANDAASRPSGGAMKNRSEGQGTGRAPGTESDRDEPSGSRGKNTGHSSGSNNPVKKK